MTARRYLVYFICLASAILVGAVSIAIYPFKLSPPDVTIDVFDKRYACGDCYIGFGILKIYGSQDDTDEMESRWRANSPERFNGWDVLIAFKGNTSYLSNYQAKQFDKDPSCAWPIFRLTGQFKRRLIYALLYNGDHYDGVYFDAHSGVARVRNSDCKKLPTEERLP